MCLVNVISSVLLFILARAWPYFQPSTEGDLKGSGCFCLKRALPGCVPKLWECLCTQVSCRKIISLSVGRVLILFLYWEEVLNLLKPKYNFFISLLVLKGSWRCDNYLRESHPNHSSTVGEQRWWTQTRQGAAGIPKTASLGIFKQVQDVAYWKFHCVHLMVECAVIRSFFSEHWKQMWNQEPKQLLWCLVRLWQS